MALVFPIGLENYSYHFNCIKDKVAMTGVLDPKVCKDLKFLFLCFTNRCGSNYVAEGLASDRQLNLAEEFLDKDEILRVVGRHNLKTIHEYFSAITLHGQKNAWFVGKLSVEHLTILRNSGILDQIYENATFVLIERNNKLAQAISYAIAAQTGQWASYIPATAGVDNTSYSKEQIDEYLYMILHQTHLLWQFFSYNGIVPENIIYEHYVREPEKFTSRLSKILGVADLRLVPDNIQTQRQSGNVNRAWRTLYLNDEGRGWGFTG